MTVSIAYDVYRGTADRSLRLATLPGAERLYLTIVLGGTETPPSREIARLMQRPVEEIYKLKQRVLQHLRDTLSENSAIKRWRASV